MGRPLAIVPVLVAAVLLTRAGWAQSQVPASPEGPPGAAAPPTGVPASEPAAEAAARPMDLGSALPPPTQIIYLQYGVAFTTEMVSSAGPICDNVAVPCIIGSGAGVAIRAGWRGAGPIYLGGAYELSKQDPNKLFRLAILQQARFEGRYYFTSGREVEPYATTGAGVAGYGNEWGVDTWGPTAYLGAGFEAQITRRTVVGLVANYRFVYFQKFQDTAGADRDGGVSQLFGLDLVLEQRDPIFTGR